MGPNVRPLLAAALAAGSFAAGPAVRAEEIVLSAAASLQDVASELAGRFESASAHRVVVNLGSSGALAMQIRRGAPVDVFFSADSERMEMLEREGLVRRSDRVDVLSNRLVVIVPAGSAMVIGSPRDLASVGSIAVGDPASVPAGAYAMSFFAAADLRDEVRDRIVPTLDVRAVLASVAGGHAAAGVVYRTDAAASSRVRVAWEVPPELSPRIVYPMAPLAASNRPAVADLARFLVSETARGVYERHGFLTLFPDAGGGGAGR